MQKMKITDWRAKRAGGRITITGKTVKGEDIKIVGVDVIESRKVVVAPLATAKDGRTYELAQS